MGGILDYLTLSPDTQYTVGLAGLFAGMCLLFSGIYVLLVKPILWRQQVKKRLSGDTKERLARVQILKAQQEDKKSIIIAIMQHLGALGRVERLQHSLLQADIYWTPSTFLGLAGAMAVSGLLLGMLKGNMLLGGGLALFLGWLPFVFLSFKKKRKTKLIEKQMPDGMELLARSLRAGHTLTSAIDLMSQEIAYPLGMEMKIVYEEQRLGLGLAQALRRMGDRVASHDLRYFVTAVLIQTESGGNLAEIMENIGTVVRERLKLAGKVHALTAEGRFSALILGLLPFVIFLVLFFLNRDYITTMLVEPAGIKMLIGAGLSVLLGAIWMKALIKIKV